MSKGTQIVGYQRLIICPYGGTNIVGRSGTQSFVVDATSQFSANLEQTVQKNIDGIGSTHDVALSVANWSFTATVSEFPIGLWREIGAQVTNFTSSAYVPLVERLSGNSPDSGYLSAELAVSASPVLYTPRYDSGVDTLVVVSETSGANVQTVSIYGTSGSTIVPTTGNFATPGGAGGTALGVLGKNSGLYLVWEGTIVPGAFGTPTTVDIGLPEGGARLSGVPAGTNAIRLSFQRNVRPNVGTSFVYTIPLYQRAIGYTATLGSPGDQPRDVTVIACAVSDSIAGAFGIVVPRAKLRLAGDQQFTQKEYLRVEIAGDAVLTTQGTNQGLGAIAIFAIGRQSA